MSLRSAQDIVDHVKSPEWQEEKQKYINYFGHVPNIIELKTEATRIGITLAEFLNRFHSN